MARLVSLVGAIRLPAMALVLFTAGCEVRAEDTHASSGPLVSAEDRRLLEEMKQKKELRADLEASPWKYVVSGTGDVSVYDKGIVNTYTEIRAYPVRNQSEFDIVSLQGEVTMMREDGTVLAIVPVNFEGGLFAGEDKKLALSSATVQGKATRFSLKITKVRLHSE